VDRPDLRIALPIPFSNVLKFVWRAVAFVAFRPAARTKLKVYLQSRTDVACWTGLELKPGTPGPPGMTDAHYDVVIVGAGPAGGQLCREAAGPGSACSWRTAFALQANALQRGHPAGMLDRYSSQPA